MYHLSKCRDGYGQERYEVLELQQRVAQEFKQLEDGRFAIIDASGSVEEVSKAVHAVAAAVLEKCQSENVPLGKLWDPPAFPVAGTPHKSAPAAMCDGQAS